MFHSLVPSHVSMKKNAKPKKLQLDRQMVRSLQDRELTAAVGGASVFTDCFCAGSKHTICEY
jgi:hypothetical protein